MSYPAPANWICPKCRQPAAELHRRTGPTSQTPRELCTACAHSAGWIVLDQQVPVELAVEKGSGI